MSSCRPQRFLTASCRLMSALEEKNPKFLEKSLVQHANLGIALSPRLAAIFSPSYILPGVSHICPAAKTCSLLLPHSQKVFHSSFSFLHTSPFAPRSTPRHDTSVVFSRLRGSFAFMPTMKCSTEQNYKTASNTLEVPPALLGTAVWLLG